MLMDLAHPHTLIQTRWDQDALNRPSHQRTVDLTLRNPKDTNYHKLCFLFGYGKTKVDALLSTFSEIILSALLSRPFSFYLFLCVF